MVDPQSSEITHNKVAEIASTPGLATSYPQNIRSFTEEKLPKNDTQFATVAAYYYKFLVPENQRLDTIDKEVLQRALREASRKQPTNPNDTLNNAYKAGLLDRKDKGQFAINAVGENLVAIALPDDGTSTAANGARKRKASRKSKTKKTPQNQRARK